MNALDSFVNTPILSRVDPEVADILIDLVPLAVEIIAREFVDRARPDGNDHAAQVAAQKT